MNNMNTIPNFSNFPDKHKEILEKQHQELLDQENSILTHANKRKYKAATLAEFTTEELVPDDQKEEDAILKMKEQAAEIIENKKRFNKLASAIFIEPGNIHHAVNAAEKILNQEQEPHVIFQRTGNLVRIIKIADIPYKQKDGIERKQDALVIVDIDAAHLPVFLTEKGVFVRYDKRSKDMQVIDCPDRIAKALIAKKEWQIPVLRGFINAPTLRSDGSTLQQKGYDKESGLLFVSDIEFDQIPENPSFDDAKKASKLIENLLQDFKFVDNESKAVAISAIMTALIRKSLRTAPLHAFSAPQPANGKTLLAQIVSLIATGNPVAMLSYTGDEKEEEKRLLALFRAGDSIICYDNIETPFGGASIAAVLTSSEFSSRILGKSESVKVSTNVTFLATGNNLIIVGDTGSRSLLCRLDAELERPGDRTFELDLYKHIPENRNKLVIAALTIMRAYEFAGCPKQPIAQFGRFEEWSNKVRSPLVWLGFADPVKSQKAIASEDPIESLLSRLFSNWYAIFRDRGVKASEITKHAASDPELMEILRDFLPNKPNPSPNVFGSKLKTFKNRIVSGYRLEDLGLHQGSSMWRIKQVEAKK
jgi:hypothetical protein